jgi:hypothetical protein
MEYDELREDIVSRLRGNQMEYDELREDIVSRLKGGKRSCNI